MYTPNGYRLNLSKSSASLINRVLIFFARGIPIRPAFKKYSSVATQCGQKIQKLHSLMPFSNPSYPIKFFNSGKYQDSVCLYIVNVAIVVINLATEFQASDNAKSLTMKCTSALSMLNSNTLGSSHSTNLSLRCCIIWPWCTSSCI